MPTGDLNSNRRNETQQYTLKSVLTIFEDLFEDLFDDDGSRIVSINALATSDVKTITFLGH